MAFGTDIEPIRVHPAQGRQKEEEVDRFDEILQEITERKEFLDEMESLGQGQQYKSKIMTEISQVRTCITIITYNTGTIIIIISIDSQLPVTVVIE